MRSSSRHQPLTWLTSLPLLPFLASTFVTTNLLVTTNLATATSFSNCDVPSYYSTLSSTTTPAPGELTALLRSTHRDALPYTSSSSSAPDVWDALISLDADPTDAGEVELIYRGVSTPAQPRGTAASWNREHLWPKSKGLDTTGMDWVDVHALRPSDWSVNAARGNKYFAACGIADVLADCTVPAHPEAASTTAADNVVWLPPANVRGNIARAIFYMAMRYDGSESGTLDLYVTDCPNPNDPADLGYLSQLLRWHLADPVDAAEIIRNDAVCEDWQGNRNPFVDYPDLVVELFGWPRDDPEEGVGYDCTVPQPTGPTTDMPVASPTGEVVESGTCRGLSAGDVLVTGFKSDNPDSVVFAALAEVDAGTTLYLTDSAWTGTELLNSEGTKRLVVPAPMGPGSIFSHEAGATDASTEVNDLGGSWTTESGTFALSASGENIFLYCLDGANDPVFLTAVTYNAAGWADPNLGSYTSTQSALPDSLPSNAVLTLPHADNYRYDGPRSGTSSELSTSLTDVSYWTGSSTSSFDVLSGQDALSISGPTTPAPTPSPTPSPTESAVAGTGGTCLGVEPGDILVTGFRSDNPDSVVFAALADVPTGATLYLTDSAWTGTALQTNEGTRSLVTPSPIAAGSIFSYEAGAADSSSEVNDLGSAWTAESVTFALSASGENIFLYCLDGSNDPVFLTAVTYNAAGWSSAGSSSYTSTQSALPDSLPSNAVLTLPHADNYRYEGPRSGSASSLATSLTDPANWNGSSTSSFDVLSNQSPLSLDGSCGTGGAGATCSSNADCLSCECKGDDLCA